MKAVSHISLSDTNTGPALPNPADKATELEDMVKD